MAEELLRVPEFDRRLAELASPAETAQLARDMLALADLIKTARGDRRKTNRALLGYAKAARKTGQLLADIPRSQGRQKKTSHRETFSDALTQAELDDATAHRWQQLAAKVPDGAWREWCRLVEEDEIEPSIWDYFAKVLRGQTVIESNTNEWYTPEQYIEAARNVMGGIDLDPASCDAANEVVGASKYFTADDDGYRHPWHGRVWLNPPYGRIAGKFISKLIDEHHEGRTSQAVALVNAHCTDTEWFQDLWDHTLCFTDHRIDFAAGTEKRSGSTHGSVFAYLGENQGAFARGFSQFGTVVRRWP